MYFIVRKQRRETGSQIAEFGPAIFFLFTFMCLPCYFVPLTVSGILISYFAVAEGAHSAALQGNYGSALAAARTEISKTTNSSLAKWLHLRQDGEENIQLFIEVTNLKNSEVTEVGPNIPLPGRADLANNLYQVEARANFVLGPFMPPNSGDQLSAGLAPFNRPMKFNLKVRRPTEYPAGLSAMQIITQN